jgi:hypothetical protein
MHQRNPRFVAVRSNVHQCGDGVEGVEMGISMQIVYLGFAGSAHTEAEAAVQLLRLERFHDLISGCHLAIEAMHVEGEQVYDVRLDLIMRDGQLAPLPHCASADPAVAIGAVFDRAVRALADRGCSAMQQGN